MYVYLGFFHKPKVKMEDLLFFSLEITFLLLLSYYFIKAFHSIWWKPKCFERKLKQQGIRGNPYKPLLGDTKEMIKQMTEAWSKPLSLSHQIVPRVDPFTHSTVEKYGKYASKKPAKIKHTHKALFIFKNVNTSFCLTQFFYLLDVIMVQFV